MKVNTKGISLEYKNGKSVSKISEIFNITENEVRSYLKTQMDWYCKSVSDLTLSEQNDILEKYLSKEFSVLDLSDTYQLPAPSVIKLLTGLGVKRVYHKGRRYEILKQTPFNKKQQEFIVGTTLGDGCIRLSGKLPRLCLVHSEKFAQYFHWKLAQLDRYFNLWRRKIDKRKNTVSLYSETLQHPGLVKFYKDFYPSGKRIVPRGLDIYMTPYSLAVWFLDNGTLNCGTNHRIYTNSFCYDDQIELKNLLKRCFDLNCKILTRRDGQHYLSFKRKDTVKLSQIIEPYVIPKMRYKLRLSLDRSSTTTRQTVFESKKIANPNQTWRDEWYKMKDKINNR